MTKERRITYRRRHCYATKSNKIKVVKTPGGRLVAQVTKKLGTRPKCGDCGMALAGLPSLRPREYSRIRKSAKHVTRPYGGSRCCNCVRERIVRAFLVEEQKIVKKVLNAQKKKEASEKKTQKKKKTQK
eukprot:TRINITY_DN21509_c0_g1_i1.p2 TRINITY_DN21509_c0_g1~~TRINITY_DN21509_c0_g1_i1.p2  ORF type:complete len:138 (-),score=36.59 TRINITY_DN21509_c0_g1_i1:82-468(-)